MGAKKIEGLGHFVWLDICRATTRLWNAQSKLKPSVDHTVTFHSNITPPPSCFRAGKSGRYVNKFRKSKILNVLRFTDLFANVVICGFADYKIKFFPCPPLLHVAVERLGANVG
jgi:hypothetical protein